jgi:hypothetical protein
VSTRSVTAQHSAAAHIMWEGINRAPEAPFHKPPQLLKPPQQPRTSRRGKPQGCNRHRTLSHRPTTQTDSDTTSTRCVAGGTGGEFFWFFSFFAFFGVIFCATLSTHKGIIRTTKGMARLPQQHAVGQMMTGPATFCPALKGPRPGRNITSQANYVRLPQVLTNPNVV